MVRYSDLILKSRIFEKILFDVKSGSLGHCYLLVSTDSVAVKEFFTLVSCAIFCENEVCLNCVECMRVLSGNNVDILSVQSAKNKNYVLADIEPIIKGVYEKAYMGGKKLYFIHNADKMKPELQNKLLKILEEPPKDVHFFISTTTEGAILDTVKSRSRRIYMDYFETRDVADALRQAFAKVDLRRIEIAASCCGGAIAKAEQLIDDEDFYERYTAVFQMLVEVKRSSDVIKYAKTHLFDKDYILYTLEMLELILKDVLLVSSGLPTYIMREKKTELIKLSEEYSVATICNIVEKINLARKKIKANCSSNAVGENLLYSILEVRFRCQKL